MPVSPLGSERRNPGRFLTAGGNHGRRVSRSSQVASAFMKACLRIHTYRCGQFVLFSMGRGARSIGEGPCAPKPPTLALAQEAASRFVFGLRMTRRRRSLEDQGRPCRGPGAECRSMSMDVRWYSILHHSFLVTRRQIDSGGLSPSRLRRMQEDMHLSRFVIVYRDESPGEHILFSVLNNGYVGVDAFCSASCPAMASYSYSP
jgi:hypothetical protein